jgi:hypothetical protein
VAKRSPILGYNHNVRYRGLVFHVQTEDSGIRAPHLFTHLFHSGVIVSTRKYVYDSGSTEETIKSLMQAQHKAVLKDLRRGQFDNKIDEYLGGTPGLLPREGAAGDAEPAEPAEPTIPERSPRPPLARSSREGIPVVALRDPPSTGDGIEDDSLGGATVISAEPAISRESTLEEPALALRPTEQAVQPPPVPVPPQPPPVLPRAPARPRAAVIVDDFETMRNDTAADSQPEITIQLEADEPDAIPVRHRRPADTETGPWDQTRIDLSLAITSDGIPGMLPGAVTIRNPGEASGPVPTGATGPITSPLSQRAVKAVGAASLPPARPISRPPTRPAIPIVRPPTADDRRMTPPPDDRRTPPPEVIEDYAALAAAELQNQPPERPGHYSQHKKISSQIPDGAPDAAGSLPPQQGASPQGVRPGSTPHIPAPARPGTPAQRATPSPVPMPARPSTPAQPSPVPMPARPGTLSPSPQLAARPAAVVAPQRVTPLPMAAVRDPGAPRPRTLTPQRVSMSTPATGTPGLAAGRAGTPSAGANVVMTRPAVIVGAPAKSGPSTQRVRKAREDEGRSFGQGLISEKSLDEVILAYLSEDAEDK